MNAQILPPLLLAMVAFSATVLLTWLAIRESQKRGMLDLPGQRRMHQSATVRGAGIGFVATILPCWLALGWVAGPQSAWGRWALATSLALALVAAIGWLDDRRGVAVRWRLLVQAVAAGLLVAAVLWPWLGKPGFWPIGALLLVFVIGAMNVWNFIDGINGLAAGLALLLAMGLALLSVLQDNHMLLLYLAVMIGSVLGFLPFNFPRARAFMGDVGSTSLGLLVAAVAIAAPGEAPPRLYPVLALVSPAFADAGLTLIWRMLRRPRRRWYTAHREHAYQWLARSGWGHVRTTLCYLVFAIAAGAAMLWCGLRRPELMTMVLLAIYLLAAALWWLARRHALRRMRA